jgi:hypothetical protein
MTGAYSFAVFIETSEVLVLDILRSFWFWISPFVVKTDTCLSLCDFFTFSCYFIRAVIAQSVYRWTTGWTIGFLEFDSRRGLGIFFTTAYRTALGPTEPLIQWVLGALSGRSMKLTTHLHLVPRSKNEWMYTYTPTIRLHGVVLSYSTGTILPAIFSPNFFSAPILTPPVTTFFPQSGRKSSIFI